MASRRQAARSNSSKQAAKAQHTARPGRRRYTYPAQESKTEEALWSAVRALEEKVIVLRRVADRARGHAHEPIAARVENDAVMAEQQAELIRELIANNNFKGSVGK